MKRKAIALISGGLDSLLAAKVVMDQGIEVLGVAFTAGGRPVMLRSKVNKTQ